MSSRPVVAIFAGSSTPSDPVILEAAMLLGRKLGEAGYDIIYGGGTNGVMGAVAKAAQDAGAHVTAVVVDRYSHEAQWPGAELIPVKTEAERFDVLTKHRSPVAFFMLPGGPGALREAIQGLEGAVYDSGPCVVLVQAGAYLDGIKQYFDLAVGAGMISASKKDALKIWDPATDISQAGIPGPGRGVGSRQQAVDSVP
jgi:uncharacterized protein (TIGR00730 family)